MEAQLPPKVEVLDEVSSGSRLRPPLEPGPRRPARRPRPRAHASCCSPSPGSTPAKLRSLALAFDGSWDLVEDRVPATAPRPTAHLGPRRRHATRSSTRSRPSPGDCIDHTDALVRAHPEHQAFGERPPPVRRDDSTCSSCCVQGAPKHRKGCGQAPSWRRAARTQCTGSWPTVRDAIDAARASVLDRCAHHLGSAMRRHTLEAADARRAAGRLEFHDLLVLARQVLRDPEQGPTVRRQPPRALPAPAARRVPGHRPDPDRAGRAHRRRRPRRRRGRPTGPTSRSTPVGCSWWATRSSRSTGSAGPTSPPSSRPGDGSRPEGGGPVELTANFRTVDPIIDWVNAHVRRAHRRGRPTRSSRIPSQPDYVGLDAQRAPAPDRPAGGRARHRGAPDRHPGRRAARGRGGRRGPRRSPWRWPSGWQVRDGDGGERGATPASATSRSSCPPARRCRSSRTRSRRPASRSGPSRARSSTPAARSATC